MREHLNHPELLDDELERHTSAEGVLRRKPPAQLIRQLTLILVERNNIHPQTA